MSSENRTKCGRSKSSKTERSYTMRDKMLLTVQEAADLTGLCTITIYELAKTQGFPAVRVGRRVLISRKGLEDWIAAQAGAGK